MQSSDGRCCRKDRSDSTDHKIRLPVGLITDSLVDRLETLLAAGIAHGFVGQSRPRYPSDGDQLSYEEDR